MNAGPSQTDIPFAGITEAGSALAAGELSARELTELFLSRIETHDKKLNSFITVMRDNALTQAAASDQRRANGLPRRPLDGIPIAIKDNIDVASAPTTAGIEARRQHVATQDAAVVTKLKEAGAVILGKLNMHEGAHGATTANEAYGHCYNPHGTNMTPGGSSGGSGAAVAAGLCIAALGTDTLGSIRIPSSFCGIAGVKPTHGLVSTTGVVPLAWTLDHVGPMARSVTDLAFMLSVLAGPDAADTFSRTAPGRALSAFETPTNLRGVRIGRIRDIAAFAGDAVDPDVSNAYETALALLTSLGAQLIDVTLSGYQHKMVRAKAMLVIEADLATYYAKALGENPLGFTQIFREGVAFGQQQSAPKLAAAYELIRTVRPIATALFADVDALATPTTPCTAFPFPQKMPLNLTAFTSLANYIGAPAVSVPMGITMAGLPLGLQITTRPWADMTALRIAASYERTAGHKMRPRMA
jgi:aspartyl-tRNA(Asn)/glutamyl-tRNA(Gln) amidotransferase subunit A